MVYSPSPSWSAVQTQVRAFLTSFLPSGAALFTGYAVGGVLTVLTVRAGSLSPGDAVMGRGLGAGVFVASLGTGTGGTGTYNLSQPLSAGSATSPLTLTSGVAVIAAQVNRVPEPPGEDFVVIQRPDFTRLATNLATYADCVFTGSLVSGVLTVTAVQHGTLTPGNVLSAPGVAVPTILLRQLTGSPPGGVGTYAVTGGQTVASRKMQAGVTNLMISSEARVQLDVHGPNSPDVAQVISTLTRDEYAGRVFGSTSSAAVSPIDADDPRQVSYENAEQQVETRYVVDMHLAVNQVTAVSQEFADALHATLIEVDAAYPATP